MITTKEEEEIRKDERERIMEWLDDNNVIAIHEGKSLNERGWLITMEKRQALKKGEK